MKKFQFRLQKLLEIRENKEKEQKIELAKASSYYQLEVNKKTKVNEGIGKLRNKLSGSKTLSLQDLQEYDRFVQSGDSAIKEIEKEIEKKRRVMDRELEKYSELRKDKRAVEILKEKQWESYQLEMSREENRTLDEIGKNVYLRHKGESKLSEK